MITQKDLIADHRCYLDSKFQSKYPNGQFVIQVWNTYDGQKRRGLYVNFYRRTSHTTKKGLGIQNHSIYSKIEGVYKVDYQNNSFGTCYYFDNINKMTDKAKKLGINADLINTFITEYNKIMEIRKND